MEFEYKIKEKPENMEKYKLFSLKTLVLGGTFDYLHSGHKVLIIFIRKIAYFSKILPFLQLFLSCSCLLASKSSSILTIGLTGQDLLTKKQVWS